MSANTQETRVLIVDDEPVELALLERILQREGYRVSAADQADQGLQMAMDTKPDLIILDVMMPLINGYNFCQLIKNQDDCRDIKIVMVTARDEMEDIEIGMQMGADAYLTKPINSQELLRAIAVVCSGSQPTNLNNDS